MPPPLPKIRVLVVDDSVVIRRLVSDVLSEDPMIEIAGTAANGRIGLAKIPQVNPDLITLDVEMPEMNGIDALRQIRKAYPRLPVIMFSTLTASGAATTIEALALGATDYVTKPANVGSVGAAMDSLRQQLIPKIKLFCGRSTIALPPKSANVIPIRKAAPPRGMSQRIDVITIGVSTGGPNALLELIPSLPANLAAPVVIVQHMPPLFTRLLAERLNAHARLTVREGVAGSTVSPGEVWLAPGGSHMTVERCDKNVVLAMNQDPPENSCRPAVDVLFRSVAKVYGGHSLAVVLTGMGQDGLRGCRDIHAAGGRVFAQDEATSVVWGMPGFVANSGVAEQVLPLREIASEIARCTGENNVHQRA